MQIRKTLIRNTTQAAMLVLLLVLGSVANADATEQLQQGEELVVLDVENMT